MTAIDLRRRDTGVAIAEVGDDTLGWRQVLLSFAFICAGVGIQMMRQIGTPLWRSVWAEDGVFYTDALHDPLWNTALRNYAGYSHFYSRVIAEIATWLPVRWFAIFACMSAYTTTAVLALYVFYVSRPLLHTIPRRAGLALGMLLLPTSTGEVVGSYANLHWMWPIPVYLTVLFPPSTWRMRTAAIALAVIAPLSNPQVILVAPFALWRIGRAMTKRSPQRPFVIALDAVLVLTSAVQVAVYLGDRSPAGGSASLTDKVTGSLRLWGLQVTDPLVFGAQLPQHWLPTLRWWLPLIASVLVVGVVAGKAALAAPPQRAWMIGFALSSIALYGYAVFGRPMLLDILTVPLAGYANVPARYELCPQLLLLIALLLPLRSQPPDAVMRDAPARRQRLGFAVAAVAFALPVVAIATSYRQTNARSAGAQWMPQVDAATERCLTPDQPITIRTWPPRWFVRMSCGRLEAG